MNPFRTSFVSESQPQASWRASQPHYLRIRDQLAIQAIPLLHKALSTS